MGACQSCCGGEQHRVATWRGITGRLDFPGKSRDGLYEPVLADSEREAVADLLQYLENVSYCPGGIWTRQALIGHTQRGETDFFSGEPLRALSTLVFSDNIDLQRSASLTFAEITERGGHSKTQDARRPGRRRADM
jgi:vacuolar protein 8